MQSKVLEHGIPSYKPDEIGFLLNLKIFQITGHLVINIRVFIKKYREFPHCAHFLLSIQLNLFVCVGCTAINLSVRISSGSTSSLHFASQLAKSTSWFC